jgi:hypothetical protein
VRRLDTGLRVRDGDQVVISAAGSIWTGVWRSGRSGPDGWINDRAQQPFPLPGAAPFSLIAGYADQDFREWWVAGSYHEQTHRGPDRTLALAINTHDEHLGDECLSVRVRIVRAEPASLSAPVAPIGPRAWTASGPEPGGTVARDAADRPGLGPHPWLAARRLVATRRRPPLPDWQPTTRSPASTATPGGPPAPAPVRRDGRRLEIARAPARPGP